MSQDPPLVCALYHVVDVLWSQAVEQLTQVERAVRGAEAGDRVEKAYRAIWPHDRFTRDDIDSAEVQRGFLSMKVGTVSRAFYRTSETSLLYHKGLLRVALPGTAHDPYFVGFAPDLLTAATWVATGRAALLVPWESAA
jgi:hypothetical protein